MDQQDFTKATALISGQLHHHALRFTGDEDDAKDLVQDTLIKGIRFCTRFQPGTNLKAWLYVIMKNTFYNNCVRLNRKREVISDEDPTTVKTMHATTDNLGEGRFTLRDIQKALDSIRPDHRIAFQRYFEGYHYGEIAEELGVPLGTVKTFIYQARCELKKYLRQYRS